MIITVCTRPCSQLSAHLWVVGLGYQGVVPCPQRAASESEKTSPSLSEPRSDGEPSPCSQRLQSDEGDNWHGREAKTVTEQHDHQHSEMATGAHTEDAGEGPNT